MACWMIKKSETNLHYIVKVVVGETHLCILFVRQRGLMDTQKVVE